MLQYEIIVVTPFAQNCTLLWDDVSKDAVLIDAGGDVATIKDRLEKHELTLNALWVTHAHLDHVGAVGELAESYDVPIIGPHKDDGFWINALDMQAQMFNFPKPKKFTPTRWLEHGDTVTLGEHEFEVRHVPGHTPGHIVFYQDAQKLLWTGDVLFHMSIGRTDFPQGDHATLIRSIKEQVFTLADETQFICGHGPMSSIGYEKANNPFVAGRSG